jgi:hypothetical protein
MHLDTFLKVDHCACTDLASPLPALLKIKLHPPDFEWVAQVSLLRPGFSTQYLSAPFLIFLGWPKPPYMKSLRLVWREARSFEPHTFCRRGARLEELEAGTVKLHRRRRSVERVGITPYDDGLTNGLSFGEYSVGSNQCQL